jgi:hypothetical protein
MLAHAACGQNFYNGPSVNQPGGESIMMGTTLHNKIQLGRSPLLGSRRMQAALALSALAGAGLVWAARRVLNRHGAGD